MDTEVGTVDVAGRIRKLVAVFHEQAMSSENSCDSDGTLRHRWTRVRVTVWCLLPQRSQVSWSEKRISSAREANVSDLWVSRSHRYFQAKICESHREDSQGYCFSRTVKGTSSQVDMSAS